MSSTAQLLLTLLLLDLAFWAGAAVCGIRRHSLKTLGHVAAYHALGALAIVMILPFYWMIATSLKDFESANRPVPTWLPLGTKYYAPPPPAKPGASPSTAAEIEVGLIRAGDLTWDEIRLRDAVTVAPVKRLQETASYYTVRGSEIRRERGPQWRNYVDAWRAPARGNPENPVTFTRYFWVSGVTSILVTIGTLFTSILAAYAFAKMEFRGKNVLFYLILATLMVPAQVLLIPNFLILSVLPDYTFGMRWLDNYPALIVPWLASVFGIFMLRQFFRGIPDELWDAAQIDGAGRFRYLWQVMLPLSKPAIITLALFAFLGEWNSLLWPLIVTTSPDMRTLMVGLQTFNEEQSGSSHLLMAAATIAVMPVVALFFVLQRFFVAGIGRTGFK
jgi:multiple sugar transport system permease protein